MSSACPLPPPRAEAGRWGVGPTPGQLWVHDLELYQQWPVSAAQIPLLPDTHSAYDLYLHKIYFFRKNQKC